MEKEFCSYEQALVLKELGFDEPCFGTYSDNKLFIIDRNSKIEQRNSNYQNNTLYDGVISAPLYQQAFRWFRDKYGLEGVTQRAEDFMWYKWTIHQYNENSKKYVANWYKYKTYEEAELECLKKLIEIVKEQK